MMTRRLADVYHHARGRELTGVSTSPEARGCSMMTRRLADVYHHARGRELTGGASTSPEARSMYYYYYYDKR